MKKISLQITRKKLRIIIWSLFMVFFLTVCLPLLFFYTLFDQNTVRQMIVSQINNKNYSVQINGNVEPRSWHGLSLYIADLTVFDKSNNKVIHVNTTNCQLSWLDLIVGHYNIRRVAMNGLTVYQNNVDANNYSDLFNYDEVSHSEFKNLKRISISNLTIVNNNGSYLIKDANFIASDLDSNQPLIKLYLNLTKYNATLNFSGNFNKSADSGDLKIDNLNMSLNGDHYKLELQSGGHYDFHNQELWLEGIRGNIAFPSYQGSITSDTALLSFYGLTVNELQTTLNNIESATNKVIYANVKNLRTSDYKTYTADGLVGEFDSQTDKYTFISTVRFTNPTLDENLTAINQSCIVGYKFISKPHNKMSNGSLRGDCSIWGEKDSLQLNLNGVVDKSPAQLKVNYSYHDKLPSLQIDGNLSKLELDRFIGRNDADVLPLYADDRPLPFDWITWLNAKVNLTIQQLDLSYIVLNNVSSQFNVNNGELKLKSIKADTYDGKLSGAMTLKKNAESYDIAIENNVSGVNLQKIFNSLFNVSAINGNANVNLSARMSGMKSYQDLYKNLTGTVKFTVANGGFSGIDFNMFLSPENLAAFRNQGQIITNFTALTANFTFANGISNSGDLEFSSPNISASGDGKVDFVNNKIDYNMVVKSILPNNVQNIKSVSIPIAISGELFSPKIYIKNMTLNSSVQSSAKGVKKSAKKNTRQ